MKDITIQKLKDKAFMFATPFFILFVLFLGLKLEGKTKWHWAYVFAPVIAFAALFGGAWAWIAYRDKKATTDAAKEVASDPSVKETPKQYIAREDTATIAKQLKRAREINAALAN